MRIPRLLRDDGEAGPIGHAKLAGARVDPEPCLRARGRDDEGRPGAAWRSPRQERRLPPMLTQDLAVNSEQEVDTSTGAPGAAYAHGMGDPPARAAPAIAAGRGAPGAAPPERPGGGVSARGEPSTRQAPIRRLAEGPARGRRARRTRGRPTGWVVGGAPGGRCLRTPPARGSGRVEAKRGGALGVDPTAPEGYGARGERPSGPWADGSSKVRHSGDSARGSTALYDGDVERSDRPGRGGACGSARRPPAGGCLRGPDGRQPPEAGGPPSSRGGPRRGACAGPGLPGVASRPVGSSSRRLPVLPWPPHTSPGRDPCRQGPAGRRRERSAA